MNSDIFSDPGFVRFLFYAWTLITAIDLVTRIWFRLRRDPPIERLLEEEAAKACALYATKMEVSFMKTQAESDKRDQDLRLTSLHDSIVTVRNQIAAMTAEFTRALGRIEGKLEKSKP